MTASRWVTFRYVPSTPANSVAVVGQFNNWDRAQNPLHFNPERKDWEGKVSIHCGVYPYLFVIDNKSWVRDPHAPTVSDANGNLNSQLVVLPPEFGVKPAKVGDGVITTSAILHNPTIIDTCRRTKNTGWVSLRTRAKDIQSVKLITEPNGKVIMAHQTSTDPIYEGWKASFRFNQNEKLRYFFRLTDRETILDYGANGVQAKGHAVPFVQDMAHYPLPNEPEWFKHAVIYQIFPDRFENGDPSNDGPGVKPWGTIPTPSTWKIRLGGDLQGIINRLPYLKRLGINCIYLNPIFKALSNHGYDTTNTFEVDPRFGTNALLKVLVEKAHHSGIRVILDGVFNHVSPQFFAFQDVIKKGSKSAYASWFFIRKYPVEVKEGQDTYATFAGVPTMVKVNQDNPSARAYFLRVAKYWIQTTHIDGWRLDDANEVSSSFWRDFRKVVKRANPMAVIIGEEWGDAHPWLQGDMHDSVMNYRWRDAVLSAFVKPNGRMNDLVTSLNGIRSDYPEACFANEFNLLGSHDTERIFTLCQGDFLKEAKCLVFQFLYPGVPTVYYGDEIGMAGGHDPDDRRPMIWNRAKWNRPIFDLFKSLIHLRRTEPALVNGSLQLVRQGNSLVLVRKWRGTVIRGRFDPGGVSVEKESGHQRWVLLKV